MKARTMRVEINTQLYKAVIAAVENEREFALEGKFYDITGAQRIEHTNLMRIEMRECNG